MARSPITDSLKRVNEAIAYLQNSLNPGEIDLLLDELAPLPEPEQPARRTTKKKRGKTASKSPRATALESQLKASIDIQRQATKVNRDDGNEACGYVYPDKTTCTEPKDSRLHDAVAGYVGYHEFQPVDVAAVASASGD